MRGCVCTGGPWCAEMTSTHGGRSHWSCQACDTQNWQNHSPWLVAYFDYFCYHTQGPTCLPLCLTYALPMSQVTF